AVRAGAGDLYPAGSIPFEGRGRRRKRGARQRSSDVSLGGSGSRHHGVSFSSIHEVPNLSRSMAKRFAKNVFSIFMKICPPSESNVYTRSASSAVSVVSVR